MKKGKVWIAVIVVLAVAGGLAWIFWPASTNAPANLSPISSSPIVPTASGLNAPPKTAAVEMPQQPPAAAANARASQTNTPGTVATWGNDPAFSGTNQNPAAGANSAPARATQNASSISQSQAGRLQVRDNKIRDLDQFKTQSQSLLDKKAAELMATMTDPATLAVELAKLDRTRQTYDAFIQQQQAAIDALSQPPPQ